MSAVIDQESEKLKYKIKSLLALYAPERQSALKLKIMQKLKMANARNYYRWIAIKAGATAAIPYDAMMVFANALGVDHKELINS